MMFGLILETMGANQKTDNRPTEFARKCSRIPGLVLAFGVAAAGVPVAADGDAKAGKKVFKKCKACHSLKEAKTVLDRLCSG